MKRKQPEDKILNCKCLLRSSAKMPLLSFSTGVTVSSVAPFQAWVISAIFRLVLFLPSHPPQASGKTYTAPSSPNSEVEVVSLASFLRYFHFCETLCNKTARFYTFLSLFPGSVHGWLKLTRSLPSLLWVVPSRGSSAPGLTCLCPSGLYSPLTPAPEDHSAKHH